MSTSDKTKRPERHTVEKFDISSLASLSLSICSLVVAVAVLLAIAWMGQEMNRLLDETHRMWSETWDRAVRLSEVPMTTPKPIGYEEVVYELDEFGALRYVETRPLVLFESKPGER